MYRLVSLRKQLAALEASMSPALLAQASGQAGSDELAQGDQEVL